MTVLRHLLAILVLPFTVTILVPRWIANRYDISATVGTDWLEISIQLAGVVSLAVGLVLFASSLRRFAVQGKGTLAPWDPPRQLVIVGPYRFVRNPMISGVLFILFGEALILLSWPHFQWAVMFLVINAIYIPLFEEPQLEARFGEPYREYKRHVGRVIPRLTPWSPEAGLSQAKRG
jgi:protein-S-isoprenylcysteine O-methyltransferase Ste14